jgi:cytochrome c
MRLTQLTLLAICVATMAGNPSVAADARYGEYLATECATCHQADAATALRPLSYEYLVAALKEYRNGTRVNATMQSVARPLGDAEIEALAAYFSSAADDP